MRLKSFPPARWEGICARLSPACAAELRAAAITRPASVEISVDTLSAIMARCPLPRRGLGDLVATIAEPIAALSDKHLGTHLVGCNSCAQRRAALNKAVSWKL